MRPGVAFPLLFSPWGTLATCLRVVRVRQSRVLHLLAPLRLAVALLARSQARDVLPVLHVRGAAVQALATGGVGLATGAASAVEPTLLPRA